MGFSDKSQLVVVRLIVVVWWNPMANRIPQVDVIVGVKVFFVVQVRFQMKWMKSLMRKMMTNFELSVVVLAVFLPRVLHVVVEPVEQSVQMVVVVMLIVMVVQLYQVVVHQFACGRLYVLQLVSVLLPNLHNVFQPYFVVIEDRNQTTYHMYEFQAMLQFEDVQERRG